MGRPLPTVRSLIAWAVFALSAVAHPADAADLGEYQVKAGFLFNFAKFTEWPAEAFAAHDPRLGLCIIGKDPFGGAVLAALESRAIGSREFHTRRGVTPEDLGGCQVLFIALSEDRNLLAILRAVAKRPILTISDIDGFVEAGGMIGLLTLEDRIQFDVNLAACQQASLKPSSQMLKLARQVFGGKGR
jgi:hypothetical protein